MGLSNEEIEIVNYVFIGFVLTLALFSLWIGRKKYRTKTWSIALRSILFLLGVYWLLTVPSAWWLVLPFTIPSASTLAKGFYDKKRQKI